MIPGTTPEVTLKFKDTSNFDGISKIWITFKSKLTEKKYEKTFEETEIILDTELKTMTVSFTQEETLKMVGLTDVEVQVRIKYEDTDKVFGTTIKDIPVTRLLKGGVM